MTYHASIAILFFARRLGASAKGARGLHQPTALLAVLWSFADPHAISPRVSVSIETLQGVVGSASRLCALRQVLIDIDAIKWEHGVYTLLKPAIADLDDLARSQLEQAHAQLEAAQRMVGASGFSEPKPKHERQPEVDKSAARDYLASLGKQFSDVRDVLAKMAGVKPSSMVYVGKGAMPVRLAVEWLASTRTSWARFVKLCERVSEDKSADKPKGNRVAYLFEDTADKRAYLQRMLASDAKQVESETSTATQPAEKSLEEQQLDLLMACCEHAPDHELPAVAKKFDIPDEVLERFRATRAAQPAFSRKPKAT